MGVAGMVLGIVAVVFGFIPVIGAFIAFPCIAVGLPLSGVGLYRKIKANEGKGIAITGIVTNTVALVIVIIWLVAFGAAIGGSDSSQQTDDTGLVARTEGQPLGNATVAEIYMEYKNNEARANDTYKGKRWNLSFTVDEVEDDHVVQELDIIDEAQLKFLKEDLLLFNRGDMGQAICEVDGFDLDTFLMIDCR